MQAGSVGNMQTLRSSSLALARRALGAQLPLHRLTAGTCKALRSSSAVCQLPGAGRAGAGRGEAFSTQGSRSLATASRALPRAAAVEAPSAGAAAQQASNGGGSAAAGVPTFQEAIARLQTYWASVGCAMWLPHNTEVGGGRATRLGAQCVHSCAQRSAASATRCRWPDGPCTPPPAEMHAWLAYVLPCAGGCWHHEPGNLFAGAGPRALECGLCGALHSPG